ncbi:MAG TPA: tyrosine-type recombinase/integrase [Pseudoclavibacter sp.]|nr:tyrosine-type recombinase/integrase [Pseudoclavibacter sp.]
MDWEQTLSDYATHQRAQRLSEKTIKNRAELFATVARVTRRGPNDVTYEDLLRVLGRPHPRTGERLAPGTMQSERSYMQAFFKWMKKTGRRKDNPAKNLPKIKMARRRPRPLRLDQIEAVLDCGIYTRTRDIITIGALSGLRIGEIVKIRGEDVDLIGMTIRSTRKGNLDHRVPLHPALVPIFERLPRDGWVFPSPYPNKQFPHGGGHILMGSASDRVSKALRAAGIVDRRITAHSLRHFLATTLLRDGVPIRVVQEILGHASLATTQLYAEVLDDDMQRGILVAPSIELRSRSGRGQRAKSETLAA